MAKKVKEEAQEGLVQEVSEELTEQEPAPTQKRKYKLKGLLVWGSIVYSDADDAVFPMTDEVAEQLIAVKPELIQLFDVLQ